MGVWVGSVCVREQTSISNNQQAWVPQRCRQRVGVLGPPLPQPVPGVWHLEAFSKAFMFLLHII